MNKFLNELEMKYYSQQGEDGIIEYLINSIGIENKYYVEFGVQDSTECNTRYLREKYGFTGLMMDGSYENKSIGLYKEFVTKENINKLFEKYNVPHKFDILSIDIDYNDLWIWKEIDIKYRPNIIVIEYNSTFPPPISVTVPYKEDGVWDGTCFFGASLSALNMIAEEKGYSLIYCDKRGVNSFFVLNEKLNNLKNLKKVSPEEAYETAKYGVQHYALNNKNIYGHRVFNEKEKKMQSYPDGNLLNIFGE
jgi:hypothetical protein